MTAVCQIQHWISVLKTTCCVPQCVSANRSYSKWVYKQCICMSDYDGNKSDSVMHHTPQSDTICSGQSACEKMKSHLSKHTEEGIALDPVQRHGNQDLMEYG